MPNPQPSDQARTWLRQSDAELLADCEVDTYRASGPGGQKRNKTSSAVRLRHRPTGLMVTASESRSQHENRARAVRRLRQMIALTQRNPFRSETTEEFYTAALARDPSLRVSAKHPDYWLIVQHVLDVFAGCGASTARAAETLNISTGHLIRFFKHDPKVWEQANRLRQAAGFQALR